MPKFGKLELTDDSDEDTEDVRTISKRKRAVETIIISSDEDDENSSDLSSLPPSPAPVRRPVLERQNGGSRESKSAERVQATRHFFGSTSGNQRGGTSSGDDEDVTILEVTPQRPASTRGTQKPAFQNDEDSDNDSVYEIPPPAPARTIQADMTNTKKIPYNKSFGHPSRQSSTILAAGVKPSQPLVYNPPTSSSSQTHVPHSTGASPTIKLSQALPNKLAPGRSQKYTTKRSSDIASWSQSERIPSTQPRPLKPENPISALPNAHASVTAPASSAPTQTTILPTNPFPFANKPLVVRLKRPSAPSGPSHVQYSPAATVSVTPPAGITASAPPPKAVKMDTKESSAGPTLLPVDIKAGVRDSSDTSYGSPKDNEDFAPTAPITQDPRIAVGNSMPDQYTYVLTSEYARRLYQAVGSHWPPLARMREQLANAHLTEDMNGDSDVVSASEGGAEFLPLEDPWYRGYGSERTCYCHRGGKPCTEPSNCPALREQWTSGRVGGGGVGGMEHDGSPETRAHTSSVTYPAQGRGHSVEENVSVAMAMRRYAERLWSVASSVPKIWTGTVSPGKAVGAHERDGGLSGQGGGEVMEGDEDIPMPNPESNDLAEDDREGSYELPSPSTNVSQPPVSQHTTLPLSCNEPTTPIALDTPITVLSTAPTLVNDSTIPKKSTSSPVALSTPLESTSGTSPTPSQVRRTIESATIDNISQSLRSPYPYDFSYESNAMHIGSASWGANSFAMIRTTVPDSKSVVPPEASTHIEPSGPIMKLYRPTRHFLGVEPPRIPGTKKYALKALRERRNRPESVGVGDSFTEVEDLSESEFTPLALELYQAFQFYRKHVDEDLEPGKGTHKRKAVDSEWSASEEAPEYEEYPATKNQAQRGSRKRRKYSQTPSQIGSGSLPPDSATPTLQTARRLRLYSTGISVEVPFGLNVDDIDTSCIEVRQVRESMVNVTALCHQCRCHNTSTARKAQCGNITIKHSSHSTSDRPVKVQSSNRCNKTFCERCLRGWYGFDDDAMEFVKGGQEMTEGKGTGTGIGLGIVEGTWICPFCINLCMCTVCSRKQKVERTRYVPSENAVISVAAGGSVERKVRTTSANGTHRKARSTPLASDSGPQSPSSTHILPISLAARRPVVPPVPMQWLPAIPTPTPGLDPIYYEATRPCTRDFPTGAPQPTAANHAPIVYHVGAALENDGLEDSFTGSEASEDEADGEETVGGRSAGGSSKSGSLGRQGITASGMVAPTTRKNFLIVAPGRRMPSTTKKRHKQAMELFSPSLPTLSPQLTPLAITDPSNQISDSITRVSFESPVKALPDRRLPVFEDYPTTVNPTHLSGFWASPQMEELSTQSASAMMDIDQATWNVHSQHTGSPRSERSAFNLDEVTAHPSPVDDGTSPLNVDFTPRFGDYDMHPNEAGQSESPNLAMGNYDDFLPIPEVDRDATESLNFPLDNDGDILMEDGELSLFLGHSSPHQDPGAPSPRYDLLSYIDNLVGESSTHPYVPTTTASAIEGEAVVP